jgi:hypothetical protein
VARHGGVEVDTQGDAFFVAFPEARAAFAAAGEAQEALELPARLGIHTGPAQRTDEGVRRPGPLAEGGRARRCLAAAHDIGDRQDSIYALALLAWSAAAVGDCLRAGRLWGAIEAEMERGPIGQWEAGREEYARHVLVAAPDFEQGRAGGRLLSLDEAVAEALSVDSRS